MFKVQAGNAKTHRTKKIDKAFRAVTDPVAAVFVCRDPSNLLNDLNGAQHWNVWNGLRYQVNAEIGLGSNLDFRIASVG
jgi:hypothetical protein